MREKIQLVDCVSNETQQVEVQLEGAGRILGSSPSA